MKFRFLALSLLALLLVVTACVPPVNLRNEKFMKDDSLFKPVEGCDAPCWRGITPGVTAWTDAVTILEDATDLDNPQVQKDEQTGAVGALWKQTGGDDCCQMVSEHGEIVDFILMQFAPNHTLAELIAARGEPQYVIASPGVEDQAVVNLFYPEQQLIVIIFVAGNKGQVSETSEVIGAYYLTAERMDLLLKTTNLYAWKGFTDYAAYSPEATNADFAVTPSVTLTPASAGS